MMLIFDIVWMGAATLLFDSISSDEDYTFFKLPFSSSVGFVFVFVVIVSVVSI